MTRQQVARRQWIAVGLVLVLAVIVVAVNLYLRTFAFQVRLGKLVAVEFSTGGAPEIAWTDPKDLAKIRASLPRLRPGSGYPDYVHSHQNISLTLIDDQGRGQSFALPIDESSEVAWHLPNDYERGSSWAMPEFLYVIGTLGMEAIAQKKLNDPVAEPQFKYWKEHFGKAK